MLVHVGSGPIWMVEMRECHGLCMSHLTWALYLRKTGDNEMILLPCVCVKKFIQTLMSHFKPLDGSVFWLYICAWVQLKYQQE